MILFIKRCKECGKSCISHSGNNNKRGSWYGSNEDYGWECDSYNKVRGNPCCERILVCVIQGRPGRRGPEGPTGATGTTAPFLSNYYESRKNDNQTVANEALVTFTAKVF